MNELAPLPTAIGCPISNAKRAFRKMLEDEACSFCRLCRYLSVAVSTCLERSGMTTEVMFSKSREMGRGLHGIIEYAVSFVVRSKPTKWRYCDLKTDYEPKKKIDYAHQRCMEGHKEVSIRVKIHSCISWLLSIICFFSLNRVYLNYIMLWWHLFFFEKILSWA